MKSDRGICEGQTRLATGGSGLLSSMLHALPFGVALTDEQGVFVLVNPAYAQAFGYQLEELDGQSFFQFLPQGQQVAAREAHRAIVSGRLEEGCQDAVAMAHRLERSRQALSLECRLAGEDGRFYRLTAVLECGVSARPARALAVQPEPFASLVGSVCNDFNNILAIIHGYAALLDDPHGSAKRSDAVEGVQKAVLRAANLVRQVQAMGGRPAPRLQAVDINDFLQGFRRSLKEGFDPSILFEVQLGADLPLASVDVAELSQALLNLCGRARDCMPGGGRMLLRTAAIAGAELRRRFPDAREEYYVLILTNARPHEIVEAEEDLLIRSFTSALSGERSDLALTLVAHVVEAHRGYLDVQPQGDGIELTLALPGLPELGGQSPAEPERLDHRSPSVLVVDDEDSLLNAICHILERAGYETLKARDGVEAVHLFRSRSREIDLVLCDLALPRMSGWEAFIKMREIDPDVRIIIMSGYLDPTLESEIVKAGARQFVQKPLALQQLVQVIRTELAT